MLMQRAFPCMAAASFGFSRMEEHGASRRDTNGKRVGNERDESETARALGDAPLSSNPRSLIGPRLGAADHTDHGRLQGSSSWPGGKAVR
ncbi:MAG: hypothetical protein CMJ89_11680 [Planctomycetes bacterium]|jgi:hypothetical protein|nr:hypothetical protein [Planctomycetota bacterium]